MFRRVGLPQCGWARGQPALGCEGSDRRSIGGKRGCSRSRGFREAKWAAVQVVSLVARAL